MLGKIDEIMFTVFLLSPLNFTLGKLIGTTARSQKVSLKLGAGSQMLLQFSFGLALDLCQHL